MFDGLKSLFTVVVEFFFAGGFTGAEKDYDTNIRRLREEQWFRELHDHGLYIQRIEMSQEVRNKLSETEYVDQLLQDESVREDFIRTIKHGKNPF